MNKIEPNRLIKDKKYRTLLIEFHSFVGYIISEFNRMEHYQITSSSFKFNKDSEIVEFKDELLQMLKQTFLHFDVILQKYGDRCEIEKDDYCITVSWENYIDR